MFKLLIIGLIIWLVLRGLRARPPAAAPRAEQYQPMARCSRCGVYLPATALGAGGRCSQCAGA